MLKLGVLIVYYKTKPFLELLVISKLMLQRGFDDKFLGHPLITDSVHHASEVLKTLRFH